MAIRPKTQVGTMNCLCCGHEVPVKAGDSGTLNFSCPWCDFPGYAKNGTEAHKIIGNRMKRITPASEPKGEAGKPAPAVQTTPPAVSKPKPATIFG